MQEIAIFGAKSIALGACRAIQELYRDCRVVTFLVSSKEGNPKSLAGLPVTELKDFSDKNIKIIIAVPENLHKEIAGILEEQGFRNYICLDSVREADLMERYYSVIHKFPSLHTL